MGYELKSLADTSFPLIMLALLLKGKLVAATLLIL